MKVIWLETTRVTGFNDETNEPIYEKSTVKLEQGKNFNNFVEYLKMSKYKSAKVVKATEGDLKDYQEQVDAVMKPKPIVTTTSDLKKENDALKARLEKLEKMLEPNEREQLKQQADDMGLDYKPNIPTAKLKELIEKGAE